MTNTGSRQSGAGTCARRLIGQIVSTLLLGWLVAAAPVQAAGPEKTAPAKSAAPALSTEAKVQKALADIKREGAIQTRFTPPPKGKPRPRETNGGWLPDIFKWLFGSGAWIWSALGWGLIALLVLGILYLTVPVVRDFVDGVVGRFRAPKATQEDEWQWQPDQEASRDLLNEAEALARDGRFDAAVHLLLGRSVEDIARRQPQLLKPAYTARTISEMTALPPAARNAFGTIATIVERGIWARRPVDAQDWGTARDAYSAFAFGDSWKAAA